MKSKKHIRSTSSQFEMLMLKFNWSMKMNALQKILIKRCRQPLYDLKNHCKDQPGRVLQRHIRHLSDQVDESKGQFNILEQINHRRTPTENFHKCSSSDIKYTNSDRNREQNPRFFKSFDNSGYNDQFLAQFKEQKDQTEFGTLAPRNKIEQKPKVEIVEESKQKLQSIQQYQLLIFLIILLIIVIIVI